MPTGKSNGKVIVHIQEVHQNLDAQRNISLILQEFVKTDQIQLVALEGAFEPVNVERFRLFPHRDTIEKVADYLLRENKISGPIHAAFTSAKPMPRLLGIDDRLRHHANVEAYRRSVPKLGEMKEIVAHEKRELKGEKKSVFHPKLFQLDERVEAYQEGLLPLGEYAEFLIQNAPPHSTYRAIRDFTAALAMERSMNFGQVEIERKQLVQRLLQKLSPREIQQVTVLGAAYRTGRVRYGDFYRQLSSLCASKGVSLSDLKEMDAYIRYVLRSDSINPETLFEELIELEKDSYATLASTDREKQLVARSRYLNLMAKLVDFSLTPADWEEYVALKGVVQKFMGGRSIDLASFEAFYLEALARDRKMADTLIRSAPRVSVLVTGGFHAAGMGRKLTQAGFSVVSVVPKIEKIETGNGVSSLGVFTREKTPLEKLFQGEKLFLAPPPADFASLNAAAVDVIGVEEDKDPSAPLGPVAQAYASQLELKPFVASRDGPRGAEVDVADHGQQVRVVVRNEKEGISVREEIIKGFFSRQMRWNVSQLLNETLFFLPAIAALISSVLLDPTGMTPVQLMALGQWRGLAALILTSPFFLFYHRGILKEVNQLLNQSAQPPVSPAVYYFWVSIGFFLVGIATVGSAVIVLDTLHSLWLSFYLDLFLRVAASSFSAFVAGGLLTHGLFNRFSPYPAMARRSNKDGNKEATLVYTDSEGQFLGVDMEHFVHAQNILATRTLPPNAEKELRKNLKLGKLIQGEDFYDRIYRELFETENIKPLLDAIIQDSYADPRLAIEIVGQNPNPQAQSVFEAVANSLDALGFTIGQFGKGVKQIIDWLEPTGEDRLDVWTAKDGVHGHLRILRHSDGRYYIQIRPLSAEDFFRQTGTALAHGTVVKVTTKNSIPSTEQNLDDMRRNSQDALIEGIHRRYAYVPEIQITTTKEGSSPTTVNGYAEKKLIVPHDGRLPSADGRKKIDVVFSDHSIVIADNGTGMAMESLFRMFVPKQGSKHPEPVRAESLPRELAKIRVVHINNPDFKNRVSFSRNGEVVTAVDIPADINPESVVQGGLMLELGSLVEVPESRDRVILSPSMREGEKTPFQKGVEAAVQGILDNPRLTSLEKMRYVNTLIVGLDGLIQGNTHNAQVIGSVRSGVKKMVSPLIHQLQASNVIVLPHDQAYRHLAVPPGKKALYLHEQLFDWQGWVSLKAVGARIVPHFPLGQHKEKVLVVAPFKSESVAQVKTFDPLWHTRSDKERFPIIKTDTFVVIPRELGDRLLALATRRAEEPLPPGEEDEFVSLAQLINIYTAEEVVTSYELAPKKNVDLLRPLKFKKSQGEIDSEAVNAFLTAPPPLEGEGTSTTAIPNDAGQRLALMKNGNVVEIGTGRVIEKNVEKLEPLANGYYLICKAVVAKKSPEHSEASMTQYLVVHFNGAILETVLSHSTIEEEGNFIVSPKRDYIYWLENDTGYVGNNILFSVKEGKCFLISEQGLSETSVLPQSNSFRCYAPQFSPDGNFFSYHMTNHGSWKNKLDEEPFSTLSADKIRNVTVILRTSDRNVLERIPLAFGHICSVKFDSRSSLIFILISSPDNRELFHVYDPHSGRWWHRLKTTYTNATGDLTALIDEKGRMNIFLHKTCRTLYEGPREAYLGIIHAKGKLYLSEGEGFNELMDSGELVPTMDVSSTGWIEFIDPTPRLITDDLSHRKIGGLASMDFDIRENPVNRSIFDDVLHPHFPLFNINSDGDMITYKDMESRELFKTNKFKDRIVGFDPTGKTIQVINEEGFFGSIEPVSKGFIASRLGRVKGDDAPEDGLPRFLILDESSGSDNYCLYYLGQNIVSNTSGNGTKRIFKSKHNTEISPKKYTQVNFDGTYFVFTDPLTGDAVYLNPESPQTPVFVSATPKAMFIKKKPTLAPCRMTLVPVKGSSEVKLYDPFHSNPLTLGLARRVNSNLVVGDGVNGIEVIRDDGAMLFPLAGKPWTSKYDCLENSDRFLIFDSHDKDLGHFYYLMDEQGRFFPDLAEDETIAAYEGSSEIKISDSGRFSVHVSKSGTISYYDHFNYDHLQSDILPRTIADGNDYVKYRVYDKAGVVVLEHDRSDQEITNSFSLYSLREGRFLLENEDDIVIDSDGEFAFVFADYSKANHSRAIHLRSGKIFSLNHSNRTVSFSVSRMGANFILLSAPRDRKDKTERNKGFFLKPVELDAAHYWIIDENGGAVEEGPVKNMYNYLANLPRFWFTANMDGFAGIMDITDKSRPGDPMVFVDTFDFPSSSVKSHYPEIHGPWLLDLIDDHTVRVEKLGDYSGTTPRHTFVGELRTSQIVAMNSLVGEKVWFATTMTGEQYYLAGAPGISLSRGVINTEKTWVNQGKTHMLVKRTENGQAVWSLIDGQGTVTPLNGIIPNGFVPVDVNGRYFVFHNHDSDEFSFLDPDGSVSPRQDPLIDEQNTTLRTLWETKIIARRDHFIQQIRHGFTPVLSLVPSAFRDFILTELQKIIADYFVQQEKALRGRFKDAMLGSPFEEEEKLPFDLIEKRLTTVGVEVERVFANFQDRITSEPFRVQKEFHENIFKGLLAAAALADIKTDPAKPFIDAASLKALGLGWRVRSPVSWDALPLVVRLIDDLNGAVRGGVSVESIQQMLGFLSELAARAPPEEARVFSHQLGKLLTATPAAKQAYLQRFYSAFLNSTPNQRQGYLQGSGDSNSLGDLRPWVEFLTHEIDPVREKPRWIPEGEEIPMPAQGIEISQIIAEEGQRPKKNTDDLVMSMDHLIEHIWELPESNGSLEQEILRNITVQGESGAYTREIAQNSIDATQGRLGTLEVDYYLQKGEGGGDEFVEEARDNGTGALEEVALLIPRSTKAAGAQSDFAGFFGTGKYTILEDVDRVEIITKNRERAFMFTLSVKKGENGRPIGLALTRIRKLNDKSLPEGVSIRRIKSIQNTIPGLDQRLAQMAWKTFAGLSQSDAFKIEMVDSDGKRRPLEVDPQVMTEADFITIKRGEKAPKSFGPFRIYRSKGLPSQVVDRKGLRIGEIKGEYLALIPENLRNHVKELGLILQIPLPLIRGRTGFEHENDYLPTIQKYVALEFYKTLARLALTEVRPAFVFEGLASDWEMNAEYWGLFSEGEKDIIDISEEANAGRYDQISPESLAALLPREQSRTNPDRRYMKLLVLLMVPRNPANPDSRTSLFLRRLAVLQEIDQRSAAAEMRRLSALGLSVGRIPQPNEIPGWGEYVTSARSLHRVQHQRVEDFIIPTGMYSPEERRLVARAERVARLLGLERIYLVSSKFQASGLFGTVKDLTTGKGHPSLVLNQGLLHSHAAYGEAVIESGTDTIAHELGHFLEHLMNSADMQAVLEGEYRTHPIEQTHEQIGPFAEAMKYVSALWLANGAAISSDTPAEPPIKPFKKPGKRTPSSPNSLAYLLTGNPWLGMTWVILVEIPVLLTGNMPALLPIFALAHVAIEFIKDPRPSLTQLAKSYLKHLLAASPYLLVAGVPGFDWATVFAVATHIIYDVLTIYQDRRDARRYADLVAKNVAAEGASIIADDLVPFEGSLNVESIEGRLFAIHHQWGPKLRQPGFRSVFEKALKMNLSDNRQGLPGFDLALGRLLGSMNGTRTDKNSTSVIWLVVDQKDISSLNDLVGVLNQLYKAGDLKTRLIISPARESLGDQLIKLYGAVPFASVLPDPVADPQMNLRPELAKAVYKKWLRQTPTVAETPFALSMVISLSIFVDAKIVLEAASNPEFDILLKDALKALLNQRIEPVDIESLIRLAQMVASFA